MLARSVPRRTSDFLPTYHTPSHRTWKHNVSKIHIRHGEFVNWPVHRNRIRVNLMLTKRQLSTARFSREIHQCWPEWGPIVRPITWSPFMGTQSTTIRPPRHWVPWGPTLEVFTDRISIWISIWSWIHAGYGSDFIVLMDMDMGIRSWNNKIYKNDSSNI